MNHIIDGLFGDGMVPRACLGEGGEGVVACACMQPAAVIALIKLKTKSEFVNNRFEASKFDAGDIISYDDYQNDE